MITSGGNRKPASAEDGADHERDRAEELTDQRCLNAWRGDTTTPRSLNATAPTVVLHLRGRGRTGERPRHPHCGTRQRGRRRRPRRPRRDDHRVRCDLRRVRAGPGARRRSDPATPAMVHRRPRCPARRHGRMAAHRPGSARSAAARSGAGPRHPDLALHDRLRHGVRGGVAELHDRAVPRHRRRQCPHRIRAGGRRPVRRLRRRHGSGRRGRRSRRRTRARLGAGPSPPARSRHLPARRCPATGQATTPLRMASLAAGLTAAHAALIAGTGSSPSSGLSRTDNSAARCRTGRHLAMVVVSRASRRRSGWRPVS
jgi:hypothetical protein